MANKKKSSEVSSKEQNKKATSSQKKETTKKVEKTEPVIETPVKTGMSETTRGMIIGIVITSLIAAIIILLILGKNNGDNKANKGSDIDSYKSSAYASLTSQDKAKGSAEMQKFYDYFDRDEPTLIVFASATCGWCELQKPIVKRIGEMYNLDYLFMDVTLLENDEVYDVISYLGIEGSTPTSLVVQSGSVLNELDGMVEGKEYVSFLVESGVLPTGSNYKDEENLIRIDYAKVVELVEAKDTSVILFDLYASTVAVCGDACLEQRAILNAIAKENNIPIYHYHANDIDSEFIEKLGDWGYDTDDYKENKSVGLPLLMFVKDGKLVWYQNGNMTEDDIRKEFKNYGLIG